MLQQSLFVLLPPPETTLRRASAKIPGYGAPDVYYPVSWQGTWNMRRQVSFGSSDEQTTLLEYPVRFLLFDEDIVIADRAFNQGNLENSITANTVRSSQWSASNPNVLRMEYNNGKTKEMKVTKRATERTESTVFSSEFQLVTQEDDRGIPVIFPRRVVTKWKVGDNNSNNNDLVVEGLEIVYDMTNADAPKILSKSRITLQR
jgi:hypothetical protein